MENWTKWHGFPFSTWKIKIEKTKMQGRLESGNPYSTEVDIKKKIENYILQKYRKDETWEKCMNIER